MKDWVEATKKNVIETRTFFKKEERKTVRFIFLALSAIAICAKPKEKIESELKAKKKKNSIRCYHNNHFWFKSRNHDSYSSRWKMIQNLRIFVIEMIARNTNGNRKRIKNTISMKTHIHSFLFNAKTFNKRKQNSRKNSSKKRKKLFAEQSRIGWMNNNILAIPFTTYTNENQQNYNFDFESFIRFTFSTDDKIFFFFFF